MPSPPPLVDTRFNAPDADISIISSNNVLFKIHSKALAFGSNAFPLDLSGSAGSYTTFTEPARFEESSTTLRYLFAFCYNDKDHPTLAECDPKTVVDLGIAAHKYMVPAAKSVCFHAMKNPTKTGNDSILRSLAYLTTFHPEAPPETFQALALKSLDWNNHLFAHHLKVVNNGMICNAEFISIWRLWKSNWLELHWTYKVKAPFSSWASNVSNLVPSYASCIKTVKNEVV
ncbi:hypothetical protein DL96DRAFT_774405, partial [Flagelloscypha sp. PMI_526]